MKIVKIINNNIITSTDDLDHEIILMGRGIGFQVKPNDTIDELQIQKMFVLNDTSNAFLQTLLSTPIEYIELAEDILEYASKQYDKKVNDTVYVALVDHIASALDRYYEKIELKNVLLWEVKQFYKKEFEIGLYALAKIEERYHIKMLEDEAAFIAIHFVTAQLEETLPTVYKITTFMNEIISYVEHYFDIHLDVESTTYFRFTTHLKYFGQRLFSKMKVKANDDQDLLDLIKNRYPEPYACTKELKNLIKQEFDYELCMDECLYLTIHITKVVQDCLK